MNTSTNREFRFFLLTFSFILLCFNYAFAVVLDDADNGGNKTPSPVNKATTSSIYRTGRTEEKYASGEVIIKLKEGSSPALLYTQSYSERSSSQTKAISGLKAKYNLKDERPVFENLHNELKIKNLSQMKLDDNINAKTANNKAALYARSLKSKKTVNLLPIYILKTDEDVLSLCEKLKKDPDIEYAEPNYIMEVQMIPNDPYYSTSGSWGQDYDDLWGLKKIHCEEAWDIAQGEGVVVAVIDTGVDYNHEDLAANIWTNPNEIPDNGIDDDGNGYIDDVRGWDFVGHDFNSPIQDNDPMDRFGHGTHCSGTIAAIGNNNMGVIGVAPKAKIMPIKGLDDTGSGWSSDLANCIRYAADNGADVISCSWGGPGESEVLTDAFHYAYSKGCVCIAAAGNSNMDVSGFTPANIDTVIAVAATDTNDQKAYFSNYGNKIDVAAPGVDVLSLRSANTDIYQDGNHFVPSGDPNAQYYRASGTSMACPHAAGVGALILSKNPQLTNEGVKQLLRASSDDIGDAGEDIYFGYGRINALKVVKASGIYITSPVNNDFIRGSIEIRGGAFTDTFQKYELYCAPADNPNNSVFITSSTASVRDGLLGTFNTANISDGEYIITLIVTDADLGEVKISTRVNIDNVNEPPAFVNLTGRLFTIGTQSQFKVEARDPDDPSTPWGQLTYSASNLPPNATFDPNTHIFSWQPSDSDKGKYEVTFAISDNEYVVTKSINISTIYVEKIHMPTVTMLQQYPAIYGDKIVWQDYRNRNWDIYMYDLATQKETQITTDPDDQCYPAIYGDKIVWWDYRNGGCNIYMYDLSNPIPNGTPINANISSSIQANPDIYGDKIVFQDSKIWNFNIYMYDLSNKQEMCITTGNTYHGYPKIYGDKIVWQDERNSNWDIYMYDLSTQRETRITTDPGDQCLPAIYGDRIVWWDNRNGGYDIFMYDLSTQQETCINAKHNYNVAIVHPAIYDDRIVWGDRIIGNDGICMYDLSTQQEVQIAADNTNGDPAIYGDTIAWSGKGISIVKVYLIPEIISILPEPAEKGATITIEGKSFGYEVDAGSKVVFDNGAVCPIVSWSNRSITCIVPQNAGIGKIRVITPGGESNEVDITVTANPHAPVLAPIGNRKIGKNSLLQLTVSAADPDGDQLTYSASNLPQGAAFDPSTHIFTWTPAYYQEGIYNNIIFTVSDGNFTASESITITVFNRPPWLDVIYITGSAAVDENNTIMLGVTGYDPDNDPLTYSAGLLPKGATFNPSTQLFKWTPVHGQTGKYDVTFTVSDGSLTYSKTITITVNNVNRPPVLNPIGNKTVNENETLKFEISGSDPDNDPLTYSALPLPIGATFFSFDLIFNPSIIPRTLKYGDYPISPIEPNNTFTWTPTYDQAGTYQVTFTVSDGNLTASETITITVNNINRPPVLTPISDQIVDDGNWLTFTVSATDPDGDSLTYSAAGLPEGAVFYPDSHLFKWLPLNYGTAGVHHVTFTVSDGKLSTSQDVAITVNHVNRPPAFDIIYVTGSPNTDENKKIILLLSGSDPDRDPLTYLAKLSDGSPLPAGATFNPGTQALTWTPTSGQAGTYNVTFAVSDGKLTTSKTVTIKVNKVETPAASSAPAASAPIPAIPPSAPSNPTTSLAIVSQSPAPSSAPTPVTVIDISNSATMQGALLTDIAYVGNRIPDQSVSVGTNLIFKVNGPDSNGRPVACSAKNLPEGASFKYSPETNSGVFTWMPKPGQEGRYAVTLETSDGFLKDLKTVNITVR